ncbi:MAG: hemolysin III family protein [Actinobacteria bacterium]|nr:hemolysin III family protein [Actinomycetota bacterium]
MTDHHDVKDRPDLADPDETAPVPRWRGRLHQVAFFVALPAGVALVLAAPTTAARVGSATYALALAALFGTSALYHRFPWSPRGRRRMRRLDHSMIFVLIAGTYTPFSLLVLHGAWRSVLLALVWGGAALGITLKLVRVDGFRALGGTLYIVLGWLAIVSMPQFVRGLSPAALTLMFAGGVLYTVGAIVLALNRPNPSPRHFGYHEIWHSFTLGATVCHYLAILFVLLALR